MNLSTWNRTARPRRRCANWARPRLEGLEDRCLLSVTITEFIVPTANANPLYITAGPDGNLWFTDAGTNQIGEINPTTHAVAKFAIPTANSNVDGITVGPDGNLWFTENSAIQIGEINPTPPAITEFAIPTYPRGITAGPDGNLWFNQSAGQIGEINPMTHTITEYAVPYANAVSNFITVGPDGNLWFTDSSANNAIGVVTLYQTSSPHLVMTQQPPAGLTAGNPITSFTGAVTVAIADNPGGTTLGGTLTATALNGVATFSGLTLNRAAIGYMLNAYASGLGGVVTSAITVTPASATQLVITQQPPATVKVSTKFTIKASIEDAYGNVVTSASNSVSIAFANNPTGATLGGTLTLTASSGVASFTNLTINKTGSGYTLQVSSSPLTSATSNPISVTQNGKTAIPLFAPAGNPATDLSLAPLVLDSPDLWDGLRFKKRSRQV
jgi:hypothetical protein